MGYSLCARFKNAEEQNAMYEFYKSNSDIIESLSNAEGRNDSERFTDLCIDNRLSYAPKVQYLLGYDGPSGRPYYLELLIAWMAVKSAYRNNSNEPIMYYDSEEIEITKKNSFLLQVNEIGIQSAETMMNIKNERKSLSFILFLVEDFEKYAKTVEILFNTLEERWQKFQLENDSKSTKKNKP